MLPRMAADRRLRTLVGTELVLVGGLLAIVVGATLLEDLLGLTGPIALGRVAALALAAVPAALWLGYFYLQDRVEPEPKHYVAGVALLGAFVAPPLARFLIDLAAPAGLGGGGLGPLALDRVVRAVLVVGVAEELAKYLVVRATIYRSPELDEPMDGILYATAAGIGFAAAQNAAMLGADGGHIFLGTGVADAVVATLAHACFGAVQGLALAKAKFGGAGARKRTSILLGGLGGAALLNGGFALIEARVRVVGLSVQPWRAVALAAGFAAIVFFGVSIILRRVQAAAEAQAAASTQGAAT